MPRKKETLTLSVPPGTKEQLEALARRLNIFWGKSPSPSGLVTAIAQQQFTIGASSGLDSQQVYALRRAIAALIDTGYTQDAQIVLTLLVERGNLEAPLRQALLQQVGQPMEAWRILVDQQIANQQPFHLIYLDAQKQPLEFTARYAEICFYEKRFYLQIWCDQTEDAADTIPDVPHLWHNRCLRLDRIQGLVPIKGEWKGSLDTIEVQLHFRSGLVNAYESKPEDCDDQRVEGGRLITRRVVNVFWLMREVRRYGQDCVIVSPEALRDRLEQELRQTLAQYTKH